MPSNRQCGSIIFRQVLVGEASQTRWAGSNFKHSKSRYNFHISGYMCFVHHTYLGKE